ncbi:hypothetical protein [Brucella melitensis]|uniref:hypothetical protein n=1 Tax=Brucella melitensis TaxID=29459 RepID=UPI003977A9C5
MKTLFLAVISLSLTQFRQKGQEKSTLPESLSQKATFAERAWQILTQVLNAKTAATCR